MTAMNTNSVERAHFILAMSMIFAKLITFFEKKQNILHGCAWHIA